MAVKKAVDYLYDWAIEEGKWATKLVDKIIAGECLSTEDENEIISIMLSKEKSDRKAIKLDDNNDSFPITRLKSLHDIKGVNKLAPAQTMNFDEKLTVIYGDNGSGKTGYYRILKSVGTSIDKRDHFQILSNVFSEDNKQEALIDYSDDRKNDTLEWKNAQESIPGVVVFDSNCASVSIDKNRKTNLKPKGFDYFNSISSAISTLNSRINTMITELKSKELIHDFLGETKSKVFFEGITEKTTQQEVEEFSIEKVTSIETINVKIDLLSAEAKNLNPDLLKAKQRAYATLNIEFSEYEKNVSNLGMILHAFDGKLNERDKYFNALDDNRNITNIIPEFATFIQAANSYVAKIDVENYPKEGEKCVYCGQSLTKEAVDYIASTKGILSSETAKKYDNNKEIISNYEKKISTISELQYKKAIFDAVTDESFQKINQTINGIIQFLKKEVTTHNKQTDNTSLDCQMNVLDDFITTKKVSITDDVAALTTKITNNDLLAGDNHQKLTEWNDYKWFVENRNLVNKHLSTLKDISEYMELLTRLNTRRLSIKQKKAQKDIITENYISILSKEFKNLRCPENIEINVSINNSETSIKQNIAENNLGDVLSEGEQKVVSIAEFITEATIDNSIQVMIFDDPVNSLDAGRTSEIANRLVNLAKEKQIIIFTHNIVFYSSLQFAAKDQRIPSQSYYSVELGLDNSGVLSIDSTPRDKWQAYTKRIDDIISTAGQEGTIEKSVVEGYSVLRSCIEFLFENIFLGESIVRYRRNIMMTKITAIKWKEFDEVKEELNEIFCRASGNLDGHTNPDGVIHASIQELNSDYKRICEIKTIIKCD